MGKLGAWEQTKRSITQHIINPLKPDIFLFTWEGEDYRKFCKYYKPTRFSILDYSDHARKMKSTTIDIWAGLKPMTFGMKKVFGVLADYMRLHKKEYDLIHSTTTRSDILDPLKPHELKDAIKRKHIKMPFYEGHKIYDHEEELKKEFAFSFVYEKAILRSNQRSNRGWANRTNDQVHECFDKIEEPVDFMWIDGYPDYMCRIPECIITMFLKMYNIKYSALTGNSEFGNLRTKLIK